jgi:O-antigen ligase
MTMSVKRSTLDKVHAELRRISALGILIFIWLILATLHQQTPEVTNFEILIAGGLVVMFSLGIIKFLLVFRTNIPKSLSYLLAFFIWSGVNIVIAFYNGVPLLWWFRRFFPIATLPLTILVSMVAFRSRTQIQIGFITLVIISVAVVAQALLGIRSVGLAAVTNLQALRRYGGGYYSSFGVCLIIPFLFHRPRLRALIWFLLMFGVVVLLVGLILSFTRTYWISTLIAMLFMIYLMTKIRYIKLPIFLIRITTFSIVVLALLVWAAPPSIFNFLISRGASILQVSQDTSFMDRLMELQGIWNSFAKNPLTILTGNGLGAKYTFYSVDPWSYGGIGWVDTDYSHNYYAYLFWSTGLIGFLLYLFFWGSLLRRILRTLVHFPRIHADLSYCLVGISITIINLLITSLTGPPLMEFKWAIYFGVLTGIALNVVRLNNIVRGKQGMKTP